MREPRRTKRAAPLGRKRGLTWDELCAHAAALPGIEKGVSYGTPALYVRKKFLCRLKEDGDSVAIKLDFADREVLLEADPDAFYLTDHYRPYPAVLMRLGRVRPAMAVELLGQAWRRVAPKSLALTQASPTPRRRRSAKR